jgi:TolB protein
MKRSAFVIQVVGCAVLLASSCASGGGGGLKAPLYSVETEGDAELFASGVASTQYSEIRLTISPDGRTALWFSRDRPGGPGGYDIWMSRRSAAGWGAAEPVPFNSSGRDFDPAFSSDGRFVYFCSDRPGGLGGDDIYRVSFSADRFGATETLGLGVNSAGNEFAPMLSPDRTRLLFSSDRAGGAGGHDLYSARRAGALFDPATRLTGDINSEANEFDATFLSDGSTIVFARAMDFRKDRVDLFQASPVNGGYDRGTSLSAAINNDRDTYGPMLDWSQPDRLTFSGQRRETGGMDLYLLRYRLVPRTK